MKNYFIKFVEYCDDEMNVHGTCIMPEDEFDKFKKYWEKYFETHNEAVCGISSNEELYFYSFADIMATLEVYEINDIEKAVLEKFELDSFGCTALF